MGFSQFYKTGALLFLNTFQQKEADGETNPERALCLLVGVLGNVRREVAL